PCASFFLSSYGDHRALHSFPTRRSSDLTVIQAHVVAMFLPSFFTGHLITRFGVLPIIATGALIEVMCALINLAGVGFWNFFIAKDRKSTRLNSSHVKISYAVFCLKKKNT